MQDVLYIMHGMISILKNVRFSVNHSVMRIRKIYCVKLDHALYSINYGI